MAEHLPTRAQHFSIVVIGAMNPRIHHPLWYQQIGAISADEAQEALKSPGLVCVEPMAAFTTGSIAVQCQSERWQVTTETENKREAILAIARIVFQKLFETPIRIYGVNTNQDIETSVADVRACLTESIAGADLGLPQDGRTTPVLIWHSERDGFSTRIELATSRLGPDLVRVAFNTQYEIKPDRPGYFDLGALIEPAFKANYEMAVETAQRIREKLSLRHGG